MYSGEMNLVKNYIAGPFMIFTNNSLMTLII